MLAKLPATLRSARGSTLIAALLSAALTPAAHAATYRYSTTSNRIYIERGGMATLTDLKKALPRAPLELVDPTHRIWLLSADLQVSDGTILVLHGKDDGGDVDQLRLRSDNDAPGHFVQITADYGTLDLKGIKVTSWDSAVLGPDKEYATYGRAGIRVRSQLAADGVTPLESRMDVVNSDIGYLGYDDAEAYGLVWKVVGTAPDLYDRVQVRGNIIGSRLHHGYFGAYSFGLQDGVWRDNQVDHNVKYGLDPHDDSDNLVIENNDVHDNGDHGIIASQRCDHITVRGNRSWANRGNGIMLHRSSDDGLVEDNQAHDNGDSGIAIFASSRTLVRHNTLTANLNAGVRLSDGADDNRLVGNDIGGNGYGIYFYKGTDVPNAGDDGLQRRNGVSGNLVHDSLTDALKLGDIERLSLSGNTFQANAGGLRISKASHVGFSGNTLPAGAALMLTGGPGAATDVTIAAQPLVSFTQDSNSVARFIDNGSAVFQPDDDALTRIVAGGGSSMSLRRFRTGGAATVLTLPLFAVPQGATIAVAPTLWSSDPAAEKRWTARSATLGTPVHFTVGGLLAGAQYDVRGAHDLGRFTAGSDGRIDFNDTLDQTTPVSYQLTAAPAGG